jgi:hypothetical protein
MQVMHRLLSREALVASVLYALLTVVMLWPLPLRAGSTVQDVGDPLMQIWVMRSIQHQLVHDPGNLFEGTAFYPFEMSLAYSEEAISTALLAWPVSLLSGNDILAYNLLFMGSFWLMALAVYLLARELGASPGAAFVAGVLAGFAPARFGHVSHLNMSVLGWLPLALWAMTRFVRGGRRRYLLVAGVALGVQLLASQHLAVFATLALALFLPALLWFERRRRVWVRVDWALLGVALVVPYLLFVLTIPAHLEVGERYGFERSRDDVQRMASVPRDFVRIFPRNDFWGQWLEHDPSPRFPGGVALVGAVAALALARRWPVGYAVVLTAVAAVLSFGLELTLAGRTIPLPWGVAYDLFSPVRTIRAVGRFGLLTAIGIPLLAAFGYTAVWGRLRPRLGERALATGLVLTALLALLACFELRTGVSTAAVPDAETLAIYEWLADQPPGPVAEFPANGLLIPNPVPPYGLFQPIQYMYGSTRHWNRILAGYSSFAPPGHWDTVAQFDRPEDRLSVVDATNVGVLQDLGFHWVLIHDLPGYDFAAAVALADSLPQLTRVAEVGRSVAYVLEPAERVPVRVSVLEHAETTVTGAFYRVVLRFENPRGEGRTLVHLATDATARVRWRAASGEVAYETGAEQPIPRYLPMAEWWADLRVTAPPEAGDYHVEVVLPGEAGVVAVGQVAVAPIPALEGALFALETVTWDASQPLRAGDTLVVRTVWRALQPVPEDYALTVQLIQDGAWQAGTDISPADLSPPTGRWQVGGTRAVTFELPITSALAPGDYDLLVGAYSYRPGYPRVPLVTPAGAVAQEALLPGVVVAP